MTSLCSPVVPYVVYSWGGVLLITLQASLFSIVHKEHITQLLQQRYDAKQNHLHANHDNTIYVR